MQMETGRENYQLIFQIAQVSFCKLRFCLTH